VPDVHLAEFDPSRHLALLAEWLPRPHVARWWGDPQQALAAIQEHPADTAALIEVDARPVGFVCWQRISPAERAAAGLDDLPDDLVDVDIMIGDPDLLGRGVGPAALRQLVARLGAEGVHLVGLAGAVANVRALKAYAKAGFQPFRDFREAGEDMRYLVQILNAAV
jgi:aminoglycoside 6'-N-acetyltransferase